VAVTRSKKEKYPSYYEFFEAAGGKKYGPIYLFIGEEDFLIDECVDRIIQDLLTDDTKAFNLDVVYGSKADAREVLAHAASFPMMSEHRVVVVKEFDKMLSGDTAKEVFSAYIARPLDSTCLVLLAVNPDFRTKPFTDLKKSAKVFSFNTLYDNQVPAWVADRCKRLGKEIDTEACRLMQAYVGNSLRSIQNELEKLFTYMKDRKRVTVEDIADVVGVSRGFTVFDLQNAIGDKNLEEALRVVKRMVEIGESPQLVIVMLTRYFSILWKIQDMIKRGVSESEVISSTRISPYYIKNYTDAAKKFSTVEIERAFAILLEADIKLKSISPDPYHLMEMLVYLLVRNLQHVEGVLS
jgi:DNA polymerase-3 subunit delta